LGHLGSDLLEDENISISVPRGWERLPFTMMFHLVVRTKNHPVDNPPGGYILRNDDV
jgi:hypothetical protein